MLSNREWPICTIKIIKYTKGRFVNRKMASQGNRITLTFGKGIFCKTAPSSVKLEMRSTHGFRTFHKQCDMPLGVKRFLLSIAQ